MSKGIQIDRTFTVSSSIGEVQQSIVELASGLPNHSVNMAGAAVVITRKYQPAWGSLLSVICIVLGVVFLFAAFPVALVLFVFAAVVMLYSESESLTFTLVEDGRRARFTVSGFGCKKLIDRIASTIVSVPRDALGFEDFKKHWLSRNSGYEDKVEYGTFFRQKYKDYLSSLPIDDSCESSLQQEQQNQVSDIRSSAEGQVLSIKEKMATLKELHDAGLIDDAEFETRKSAILDLLQ